MKCLFQVQQTVMHVKSRTVYKIIGTPKEGYVIEGTQQPAYLYQSDCDPLFRCTIWIRPQSEMEDGRFHLATQPVPSSAVPPEV